jgi:DNA-binding PadR family transcriptional regulator
MERLGWLSRADDERHARDRRTFRITPSGRRLLERLRHDITELYEEVVLGREPHHEEKPR